MGRSELKKRIAKENNLGKRLRWIRSKVGVNLRDIERDLEIPEATLRAIENGGRTTIYEDLLRLSYYFTSKLKKKYQRANPLFNGEEVEEVTVMWLMFGEDKAREEYRKTINIIQDDFKQREMELIERNFILDQQIRRIKESRNELPTKPLFF